MIMLGGKWNKLAVGNINRLGFHHLSLLLHTNPAPHIIHQNIFGTYHD
ncbi:MAG: hypothetical protein H8E41_10975 [Desulfobulbaceae bacterium]|uniref:Uncharacterized protein n=1 Tax=Candidatus Desulfobia pelagia TaxID=2841692 RepID=A0A8J6NG73_9BACT|nr:hypothetical protein [Candidatus Desulfobia pelagia]